MAPAAAAPGVPGPVRQDSPAQQAGGAGRSAAPRVQDASLPGVFVRGSPSCTLLPLPFPIFCLASPHPIHTFNSSLAPPGSVLKLHLYTQARLCPFHPTLAALMW